MSPYQHIFSANAVLNVWRNLRHTRDPNDLFLTVQYHADDVHGPTVTTRKYGKNNVVETKSDETGRRGTGDGRGTLDGRSIGFVVPWRSMQAQKKELKEKEKELAEALVVRHLAAGLSRQMSKIELQMADNAPFAQGKNLQTGGEIIRQFLPPIQTLFEQKPIPYRMIFELLMELKDLAYTGMISCEKEVLEWELNNFSSFEDLDETMFRALTPSLASEPSLPGKPSTSRKLLAHKRSSHSISSIATTSSTSPQKRSWLTDTDESLYHLESLEATAAAMTHLALPVVDFLAKSTITLRRSLPRPTLTEHGLEKRRRTGRCAEYARCNKWAGTSWRQGGGCRRGCKNEDEDPEGLPSWHSSSRWFDERGTYMVGGGKGNVEGKKVERLVAV
ncbi:hypothetical protein DM02DRAFT_548814 [Periconia macrospinosa]|uniref:Uncharacterized protein n=1 Tax=Periconia macrospinosa TaxID=97972 RepID=A0A2V1ECY6_9PLEO|nr:hypothetical protein DM02DRAFT_548814 [Periconia macrospinosa]